jgi:chromosome partitioning protein
VIAIASQKGGSGKTTTTIHLGAGLAELGMKVLALDVDPQGHLAEGFGILSQEIEHEISEVLDKKLTLQSIVTDVRPRFTIAPSNIRLSYLEATLLSKYGRENRLRTAIKGARGSYDFILIDCPPSLGILTVNALAAADEVLVPMTCEYFSMLGVNLLFQTIGDMQEEIHPELQLLGVLPTRFNRTIHSREVLQRTKTELQDSVHIFEPIPESTRVKEASALGKTVYEHAPDSPASAAYRKLAQEIGNAR